MQYFKHMTNMRHNLSIKRLINKYGIEGYGIYNLILESIVERLCNDNPNPELQESCEDIAEFYNGNTAKINEIVCFMVNQGLLEVDKISMKITCQKIYKYLEQNQTKSKKIRQLITLWKTNSKNLLTCDGIEKVSDPTETDSGRSETKVIEEEEEKEEEIEKEKKKKKNKKKKGEWCNINPPTLEDVIQYANEKNITNVNIQYFYDYFTAGSWIDSNGNQVYNWKQKLLTWSNHSKDKKPDSEMTQEEIREFMKKRSEENRQYAKNN